MSVSHQKEAEMQSLKVRKLFFTLNNPCPGYPCFSGLSAALKRTNDHLKRHPKQRRYTLVLEFHKELWHIFLDFQLQDCVPVSVLHTTMNGLKAECPQFPCSLYQPVTSCGTVIRQLQTLMHLFTGQLKVSAQKHGDTHISTIACIYQPTLHTICCTEKGHQHPILR